MPSAGGLIKCDGSRVVGTFDVDGRPLYITVDIKPPNQPFDCARATLTYGNVTQLNGAYKWTGTAGRDDLQMDFGGGVSIAGALGTPRLSVRIRGAGVWSRVKSALPPIPVNGVRAPVNPFPPRDAALDAVAKVEREERLLGLGLPIIAIFGGTGTGKSTFINLITSEKQKVSHGLETCTRNISVVEANVAGQRIVVIDTPPLDATGAGVRMDDILANIAHYFAAMAERKVWVTGVMIFHRISDFIHAQAAFISSNAIKCFCGDSAMGHIMLCTTMWDRVPEDEGYERLDELCETDVWKEMISKGAGTAMISNKGANATAEAEKIVTQLIKNMKPVELAIQDEMVNQKLKVTNTSAGQVLDVSRQETQTEGERELKEMRDRLREENEASAARAQAEIRAREEDIARLDAQADEQARERQAKADQLKREQDRVKREIKELRKQMRKLGEANAAIVHEELLAREKEFMQQADKLEGGLKAKAKQLMSERKSAEQANEETLAKAEIRALDEESANLQASIFIAALLVAVQSKDRIRGVDSVSGHMASW